MTEKGSRSDERGRARRKGEAGGGSDDAVEFADADEAKRRRGQERGRDRRAVAEGAEPVTEDAMFGRGWLGGGRETRVVIAMVVRRRRVIVVVVGRVPAAQRAGQDQDDRQCDKRLRAKAQRT